MHIEKLVIENYRCLRHATVALNPDLNIVVGDNESGKSTLLEAIHLALTGQLNGRPLLAELHPYLFNVDAVTEFLDTCRAGHPTEPPSIFIEVFFAKDNALATLKGINNSLHEDAYGVRLAIEFNDEYREEYAIYMADPSLVRTLPIEYYSIQWLSFADSSITSRSVPLKSSFIDASTIRNSNNAGRFVVDLVKEALGPKEQADLALGYRVMRDRFLADERVKAVNEALAKNKDATDKTLSVSLDASSRSGWEAGIVPHLDDIPMPLIGKGEQTRVKTKLALASSGDSHLVLVEEAESHLSHTSLNNLIAHIADHRGDRQLLITTHSSFVLNKLGAESLLLFDNQGGQRLSGLPASTQDYFMKLPGHDTLRMILAPRAILVEGPSDELIVSRAYQMKYGKLPLEDGVDVISVNALAFKRFMDIARLLKREVDVVTDNDGNVPAVQKKYHEFAAEQNMRVHFSNDPNLRTLEPHLVAANGRPLVNEILGTEFDSDNALIEWMLAHKTESALRFFETPKQWTAPDYINDAIA
jgi:putative ATP-dependent endonuclease of OLD family